MRFLMALLLLLPGLAFGATSNVFSSAQDTVRLVSASNAPAGGKLLLALQFKLAPGWHIYWSNPGDAGFPPAITPVPPLRVSPLRFPPPEFFIQGPVTDYVLSGDVLLPFTAAGAKNSAGIAAQWLVCAEVCVPQHADFTLNLPGGPSAETGLFAAAPQIVPSPFPAVLAPDGTLTLTGPAAAQIAAARFFPKTPGMIRNAAAQPLGFTATGLTLHLSLLPGARKVAGILELTDKSGAMQALAISAAPAGAASPPLDLYLLLAFLGGLILNLMPCVFPILALKALAICRLGAGAKIRHEAFGYTFGVLAAMAILAGILLGLREAGTAAGWGFQFQSPVFVALMAWLIFALALNLAGVFEFSSPAALGRLPAQHSVATGMLAVVLATPCTAPFMGSAVAAALAAPLAAGFGIFLALGLGLAAPFLVIAIIPGLAPLLPRPGTWMRVLQRVLSLPLLATFAWLAWVLSRQTGATGLGLLLLGAAILSLALSRRRLRLAALAVLALLPFLHATAMPNALTLPGAEPYTPARLAELRAAQTPVFIDLTAAWCVTCLVNEASTLKNPQVRSDFAARHIALLVGDWTDKNRAITALLTANHRDGVPLYLYYAPGSAAPRRLPQILDPAIVEAAIKK